MVNVLYRTHNLHVLWPNHCFWRNVSERAGIIFPGRYHPQKIRKLSQRDGRTDRRYCTVLNRKLCDQTHSSFQTVACKLWSRRTEPLVSWLVRRHPDRRCYAWTRACGAPWHNGMSGHCTTSLGNRPAAIYIKITSLSNTLRSQWYTKQSHRV